MKLKEASDFVQRVKPHAFSHDDVVQWINEVEGYVQSEVFLWDVAHNCVRYEWDRNEDTELLVKPPHDKLYLSYLKAKIDFNNGEYDRYANSMAMYNADLVEFEAWFTETYHPADLFGGEC